LQSSRNPPGEENTPLIPEAYKEYFSGFDFRVNCEDDQIDIYRAASKVTAHCFGTPVNYSTWDCVQLAESSLYSTSEPCEYSFRYGTTLYPNVRDPICGQMNDAQTATCGECEPLPYPNEWSGDEFYIIDCDTGAIIISDEPDCSSETAKISIADCHTYANTTTGINNIQFLPWNANSLQACRGFWASDDCSGEADYIDCGHVCGGCLDREIYLLGDNAYGSYTNCDTFETTMYGSSFCAPDTILTDPIPYYTCVQHEGGSMMFGFYL